ncbi:hypothetical protein JA9_000601 [Meyerozyma sp. JA9]|nr:hypothetical protein JA9_000601 [Meyerozyma sp. JA9]
MPTDHLGGKPAPAVLTTFDFLPPAQKATFNVQLDMSRSQRDFPLSRKWIVYFTKRGRITTTELERVFTSKEDYVHGFRDLRSKWTRNIQIEQMHIMRMGFYPKRKSMLFETGGTMEIKVSTEDWGKFEAIVAEILEDRSK